MRFRVDIRRKEGLSDPEGLTTRRALLDLGFEDVTEVHFGRSIYIDLDTADLETATIEVESMCRKLLANPVMEEYTITLLETMAS